MGVQHTQGLMKRTGLVGDIAGYGGVFHAGLGIQPPPRTFQQEANADRLVAVWNACEGVDNPPPGIINDLLEALRFISLRVGELETDNHRPVDFVELRGIQELAIKAIAKAEANTTDDDCDRSHEECVDCGLEHVEPPQCNGHVSGPVSCSRFKQKSTER